MKEINSKEAHDRMQQNSEVVYLDVRSVPEFERGHASHAINIPILHFQPGMGMFPNDDFAAVVQAALPKDASIVVGCMSGGRSAQACMLMTELGYKDVTNIRGGFGGAVDPFGRVIEAGWTQLNLPLCTECESESNYESLASKAKK
jgi:rhodanese-related sulfurtransferase